MMISKVTVVKIKTEVLNPGVELVSAMSILQVGFAICKTFRRYNRAKWEAGPLKGLAATVEEWLMAAEYILAEEMIRLFSRKGIRTLKPLRGAP